MISRKKQGGKEKKIRKIILLGFLQIGFETEEYMIILLESRSCTIRLGISSSVWLSGPFPEFGQVFRVQFQFPLLPIARIQCIIRIYRK